MVPAKKREACALDLATKRFGGAGSDPWRIGTIDDRKRPMARQDGPITVFVQEAYHCSTEYNRHASMVTKTMSQLTSGKL
jgi:hypothetical protein